MRVVLPRKRRCGLCHVRNNSNSPHVPLSFLNRVPRPVMGRRQNQGRCWGCVDSPGDAVFVKSGSVGKSSQPRCLHHPLARNTECGTAGTQCCCPRRRSILHCDIFIQGCVFSEITEGW
eukprot:PhF_6_TR13450/c0_g1_i4/m.21525